MKSWAESEEYRRFRNGDYPIRDSAGGREDSPLLYGAFVPRGMERLASFSESACGDSASTMSGTRNDRVADGLRSAVEDASGLLQDSAAALGKAAAAFFESLQEQKRPKDSC